MQTLQHCCHWRHWRHCSHWQHWKHWRHCWHQKHWRHNHTADLRNTEDTITLLTSETLKTLLSLETLETLRIKTLNTARDTAITGIIVDSTRLKDIENVTRCRDSRSGKQGRDDSIKQFSSISTQLHPIHVFPLLKICRVGLTLYTELSYAIIPTFLPCFLLIFLHF